MLGRSPASNEIIGKFIPPDQLPTRTDCKHNSVLEGASEMIFSAEMPDLLPAPNHRSGKSQLGTEPPMGTAGSQDQIY